MDTDKQLEQIEKIAQNARTTWFGLLALLVFVGVTLMGHQDSDFFAYGAATQLPLVGIEVPPTAFFIAAPILTAAIYIYLHVYLLSLWEALGRIGQPEPSKHPPLSDRAYPTIFTIAGLLHRSRQRSDGSMPKRVLGLWTLLTGMMLTWIAGLVILTLLFWWSAVVHDFWLTVVGAIALWAALVVAGASLRAAHIYLSEPDGEPRANGDGSQLFLSLFLLAVLLCITYERTIGGPAGPDQPGFLFSRADFERAYLTRPPATWPEYPIWRRQFEARFRKLEGELKTYARELEEPRSRWSEKLQAHFLDRLQRNWVVDLNSVGRRDLSGKDLRGANLERAIMIGVVMREANLSGANLFRARLEGAVLRGANLEGANLARARMQGAYFEKTEKAPNVRPNLRNAILARVRFDDGYLVDADLQGANLWKAKLPETDVHHWNISRASLRNADLRGARNLDPAALQTAFGDWSTRLPVGYDWPCHWNVPPVELGGAQDYPSLNDDQAYQNWLKGGAKPGKKLSGGRCQQVATPKSNAGRSAPHT